MTYVDHSYNHMQVQIQYQHESLLFIDGNAKFQ